ncbi:MAG: hypothetical protein R3F03_09560 [Opitutaceae bacterium]
MGASQQTTDALILVNDPAFNTDFSELGATHQLGFLQGAEKWRIGQGVERNRRPLARQFLRQRAQVGVWLGAFLLEQPVQVVGKETEVVTPGFALPQIDPDFRAPDFDPSTAGIKHLKAQQFCP